MMKRITLKLWLCCLTAALPLSAAFAQPQHWKGERVKTSNTSMQFKGIASINGTPQSSSTLTVGAFIDDNGDGLYADDECHGVSSLDDNLDESGDIIFLITVAGYPGGGNDSYEGKTIKFKMYDSGSGQEYTTGTAATYATNGSVTRNLDFAAPKSYTVSDGTVTSQYDGNGNGLWTASPETGGTLSISPLSGIAGTAITVKAVPAAGYEASSIKFNGTTYTQASAGFPELSLIMPEGNVTDVAVVFRATAARSAMLVKYDALTSPSAGTISVNEADAGNVPALTAALNAILQRYAETGILDVEAADVSITAAPQTGVNGSFSFTIRLTCKTDNTTMTTPTRTGVISPAPVYTATATSGGNGTLTFSNDAQTVTLAEGAAVSFTATPDGGYELDALVLSGNGGASTLQAGANSFTMPAYAVTLTASFKPTAALQATESAVTAIGNYTFSMPFASYDGASTEAMKTWLQSEVAKAVASLADKPVPSITAFTVSAAPKAGDNDPGTPVGVSGTNGTFNFTLGFDYGRTYNGTGLIIAKPAPGTYALTLKVTSGIAGGSMVSDDADNTVEKDAAVTVTITSAEGWKITGNSVKAYATEGEAPFTMTDNLDNTHSFNMPEYGLTVAAAFEKTTALTALEKAQADVDNMVLSLSLGELTDGGTPLADGLKAEVKSRIEELLDGSGVTMENLTCTVTTQPAHGTETNMKGQPGKFSFNVTLKSGSLTRTAGNANGTIAVDSYVIPVYYVVRITETTGGSVTSSPASGEAGKSVTLNVTPLQDYELSSVTSLPDVGVSTTKLDFTMPASEVVITPVFKKKESVLDNEAVATAADIIRQLIDDGLSIASTQANTAEAVNAWLTAKLNEAVGNAVSLSVFPNGAFKAAVDGQMGTQAPVDGSHPFSVSVSKGGATPKTLSGEVGITAKPQLANNKYTVNVNPPSNGSLTILTDVSAGVDGNTEVTLQAASAQGYKLTGISLTYGGRSYDNATQLTFSMPEADVIVSAVFSKTPERIVSDEIRANLDLTPPNIPYGNAGDEAALKEALAAYLNDMSNTDMPEAMKIRPEDITVTITAPPTEGSSTAPSGKNGAFEYSAVLPDETSFNGTGVILPKSFVSRTSFRITPGNILGGTIGISPDDASFTYGTTGIRLTPVPAANYTYATGSIRAYKTGDKNVTVTLTPTGAADGSVTMEMPAFDVTVTAGFAYAGSGSTGDPDEPDEPGYALSIVDGDVETADSVLVGGGHVFDPVRPGYGQQTSWNVDVRNVGRYYTGTLYVTIDEENAPLRASGQYFDVTPTTLPGLAPGETTTFTVTPKTGLPEGVYTAVISVGNTNVTAMSFNVSFTVGQTTGNVSTATSQGKALTAGPSEGGLTVGGLTAGTMLYIYNVNGRLVHSATAASDTQTVYLVQRGVYILVNDNRTVKSIYN
jgi:hypothetical protein